MRTVYILEYKDMDSKGREKNSRHVGVFSDLESLEKVKEHILSKVNSKISFQVYTSNSWI